jgi:predicted DNA-binding transcriptional regulator AlpA
MVAMMLGRSERSIWRDDEEGRIPAPVVLGGSKRWRIKEIRAWVRAGCPDRATWENRWPRSSRPMC